MTKNRFAKWIEKKGPLKLAHDLGRSYNCISYWYKGKSTPNKSIIQDLVRKGRGAFTAQDIHDLRK